MMVTELQTDRDKLVVVANFPHIPPTTLFNYWIEPELLQKWWPPEAEIEPRMGGAYHLFWPQGKWHLHGHYTDFDPGKTLAFTWQWDHYPVVKNVVVTFESFDEDGSRMMVTHSPYGDAEQDRVDREGHREGWIYFVSQLQKLVLVR